MYGICWYRTTRAPQSPTMTPAEKFTISIPESALTHLRQKLQLATFPDELVDAGWAYGVPLADLRRLVSRWSEGYDWRKHEALLNAELPQFTQGIEVDGHGMLDIHYIHQRSEVEGAIPMLFVHGCTCLQIFPFFGYAVQRLFCSRAGGFHRGAEDCTPPHEWLSKQS